MPSSSSATPSSSSIVPSSSSIVPSSSSASVVSCDTSGYGAVRIGEQVWMKKNFNCNVSGSRCYNYDDHCNIYGRLYDWTTAMNLPSSCNSNSCASQIDAKHRGICPVGWHIPSDADWDKLMRYVDGNTGTSSPYNSPTAGRYLKATSGWYNNGNGQDTYGFSALPGGVGSSNASVINAVSVGDYGYWWSSSEYNRSFAYIRRMYYGNEEANWAGTDKVTFRSVRCLQD